MCEGVREGRNQHSEGWVPFEQCASRYDQWFDSEKGRRIFRAEAACMRELLVDAPRPWLEIGVGTGRFAEALQVDEGIDPSSAVLRYASQRGIGTRVGEGENLPYEDDRFGVVLLIVTICFLRDPAQVLAECRRILRPGGFLLVGLVPRNSPWGRAYMAKGDQGHPFYTAATFYTPKEILGMCNRVGFALEAARSCLSEAPNTIVSTRKPSDKGILADAGFVCMRFKHLKPHEEHDRKPSN